MEGFWTAHVIWFLAGSAFLLAEMALPGFVLLFFALGAYAASLAAYALGLGPRRAVRGVHCGLFGRGGAFAAHVSARVSRPHPGPRPRAKPTRAWMTPAQARPPWPPAPWDRNAPAR